MLLTEGETKYKVQYDLHVIGIVEMYAEEKREQVIIAVNIFESFTHQGTVLIILFGLSQCIISINFHNNLRRHVLLLSYFTYKETKVGKAHKTSLR